jgi:hypothetical protein
MRHAMTAPRAACQTPCAVNAVRRIVSETPALADFRRIVVKVGWSLLVDAGAGRLKAQGFSGPAPVTLGRVGGEFPRPGQPSTPSSHC